MERNKMGMLTFVASEAVFFALLIAAYIFYHRRGDEGPTAASSLDLVKTSIFTVALLSSSVTMHFAVHSAKAKKSRSVGVWLFATIVLGAVFLIGQGTEYLGLIREHVTISRNLFGTTFFTLTGFHGFHVAIGLVMLLILLGLAMNPRGLHPDSPAVEVISIYWHFVDVVWIAVFSVVYLWAFV
jgi:heme/copper-type cytochrome/quinol oxidase subunit 3